MWRKLSILAGVAGAVQFFGLSTAAMVVYPGGTIHDRQSQGYNFFHNYFSDLGRRRAWNGMSNELSNIFFDSSLHLVGISLFLFFLVLPSFFRQAAARRYALVASLFGIISALGYFGIAGNPLDVRYYYHTLYVRGSFLAFLFMSISYVSAILSEPGYPKRYAWIFALFGVVLSIQIGIMLFGPRSWTSPEALFIQATAQKIVVYSQMGCMLIQIIGVWRRLKSE